MRPTLDGGLMTRRAFLGTVGFGALAWRGSAQTLPPTAGNASFALPSTCLGSISPVDAGFNNDVASNMSTYLQSQVDAGDIPGAFVAVARHGKVFLEQHFGVFCDRTRRDVPYDGAADHPFHSISKMISATAVVMAWQDGRIDIDVPVTKYIPEFGQGGKEGVTIRQLLTHSAGIPATPPQGLRTTTEAQWKAAIAAVCAEPVQWPPGSRTEYHGLSGMLTAAEAVRRVSHGKTWNQICQERIFTPLGLSSLTFEQPPAGGPLACIPRPADPPAQWQAQIDVFKGEPAAGLRGGFTDILKFLRFQTQKGICNGQPLLQEKYWTEMHTPQFPNKPYAAPGKPGFENWGLGMMVRGPGPKTGSLAWFGIMNAKNPAVFSHVGTNVAMAVGDPATDTQIVFMVTDAPKTPGKTVELRNKVTDTVFDALI